MEDTDPTISVEAELDTLREGVDDPMVLKEQLRKEADARRQLTARAKTAEADKKKLEAKLLALEPKPADQTITKETPSLTLSDEIVDLRLDGYSKDEVEFIMKNGGRTGLENPFVKNAIDSIREQRKAEEAASQVPDTSGLSEIERKYTPEQLAAMSVKDLEKILPHA